MMWNRRLLRLRWKEITAYTALVAAFSTFYFGFYLPLVLSQLPNSLITYDFPPNKWFVAPDVNISDKAAFFQIPVINDKLSFAINYQNKIDEPVTIQPEFEVVYGGLTVQKHLYDPITVAPGESYPQVTSIYTNHTGLNEITLHARILNSSDHSVLDTISGTFYIRVFDQSDAFQHQINGTTGVGIYVSIGIAVFTLYYSAIKSRLKQD